MLSAGGEILRWWGVLDNCDGLWDHGIHRVFHQSKISTTTFEILKTLEPCIGRDY